MITGNTEGPSGEARAHASQAALHSDRFAAQAERLTPAEAVLLFLPENWRIAGSATVQATSNTRGFVHEVLVATNDQSWMATNIIVRETRDRNLGGCPGKTDSDWNTDSGIDRISKARRASTRKARWAESPADLFDAIASTPSLWAPDLVVAAATARLVLRVAPPADQPIVEASAFLAAFGSRLFAAAYARHTEPLAPTSR